MKRTIPLSEIIEVEGNLYELTNAVTLRALQLAQTGEFDQEKGDKPVLKALEEVLTRKVEFKRREE